MTKARWCLLRFRLYITSVASVGAALPKECV